MAIDAKCPHCEKPYRLKDELVGKKVTCANQTCRQLFTVSPSANGTANGPTAPPKKAPPKPIAPPIDADELAAAALKDDPDEVPEDQKKITMKCEMCEFQFQVEWAMQGKNTLCPDCKHRQKVPMQAKGKTGGWRERNAPEGAKIEELEGVVSAGKGTMVGREALEKGGAITVEYEDRPMSFYAKWAALAGVVISLLAGGAWYLRKNKAIVQDQKVTENFEKVLESEEMKPLPSYQAALRIALGEAEARTTKTQKDRDQAVGYFTVALANLGSIPAPRGGDVEQLYGELAIAMLHLGGEGEDLIEKRKLGWLPPAQNAAARAKINPNPAESEGVQGQLRRVMQVLKDSGTNFDTRSDLLRRLTRELAKRNQTEVMRSLIPSLFQDAEQFEAEGQFALECHRAGKTDVAQPIAEKLKASLAAGAPTASPQPASIQALWSALSVKGPTLVLNADASRFANTASQLLQNNATEAKTIATRGTGQEQIVGKLRALSLAAEWTEKPNDILEAALSIARDEAKRPTPTANIPNVLYLRLAQAAARNGMADKADEFLKRIPDENLRLFAKAEVLRHRLAADRSIEAKDEEAEIPADTDPKKLKLGHAWGRYHLARHTGARSTDAKYSAAYSKWPKNLFAPFGQVGLTLGNIDAATK